MTLTIRDTGASAVMMPGRADAPPAAGVPRPGVPEPAAAALVAISAAGLAREALGAVDGLVQRLGALLARIEPQSVPGAPSDATVLTALAGEIGAAAEEIGVRIASEAWPVTAVRTQQPERATPAAAPFLLPDVPQRPAPPPASVAGASAMPVAAERRPSATRDPAAPVPAPALDGPFLVARATALLRTAAGTLLAVRSRGPNATDALASRHPGVADPGRVDVSACVGEAEAQVALALARVEARAAAAGDGARGPCGRVTPTSGSAGAISPPDLDIASQLIRAGIAAGLVGAGLGALWVATALDVPPVRVGCAVIALALGAVALRRVVRERLAQAPRVEVVRSP
jgi:hypothetical protein